MHSKISNVNLNETCSSIEQYTAVKNINTEMFSFIDKFSVYKTNYILFPQLNQLISILPLYYPYFTVFKIKQQSLTFLEKSIELECLI